MPGRIMPHTHTVAEKHSHAPIYTHERALGSFSGPLLKIKDKTEAEISERFFLIFFFLFGAASRIKNTSSRAMGIAENGIILELLSLTLKQTCGFVFRR